MPKQPRLQKLAPLGTAGEQLWRLITRHAPPAVLEHIDAAILTACCQSWSRFQQWSAKEAEHLDAGNDAEAFKASQAASHAWKRCEAGIKKIGLSPKDRDLLLRPRGKQQPQPAKEPDPFEEFMSRRMGLPPEQIFKK